MGLGLAWALAGAALTVGAPPAAPAAEAAAKAQVGSFRINGVGFEMPVPAGYCLPKGREADVAQLIAAADKVNVTHLVLLSCPSDWKTDYILVKTPVAALTDDLGREEALKGLGDAFSNPEFKQLFSSGKALEEAQKGISEVVRAKVDLTGEIKPLGRDDTCAYLGGITEVKAATSSYRISVGGCITVVGRRLVSLFVYGPDRGTEGVAALLARSRKLVETIRVVPGG